MIRKYCDIRILNLIHLDNELINYFNNEKPNNNIKINNQFLINSTLLIITSW